MLRQPPTPSQERTNRADRGITLWVTAREALWIALEALRGHTSGLAVPHYVIDLPGGKGKVEVPSGRVTRDGSRLIVENYLGERISYHDLT